MEDQGGDVTEADANVILDMKSITYWLASGFMSQNDGEAVSAEKAKIHTEKSNGIKAVSPSPCPLSFKSLGEDRSKSHPV